VVFTEIDAPRADRIGTFSRDACRTGILLEALSSGSSSDLASRVRLPRMSVAASLGAKGYERIDERCSPRRD
jgi:hypothetical protein